MSSSLSAADLALLERTLELAERGRGATKPNPVVGCLLTRPDGTVVSEGWHERAGGPHAEIVALDVAGDAAHGSTVYVSLEPCAHHGRTPPCATALIEAGVARVVVAALDADPRTATRGIGELREAGIEVELAGGELERRAIRQNEGFRCWVASGRPFVTYKAAVTLDGKVAASSGDARWISGEPSRHLVHELRAAADAVAVGMGTVRMENPLLTARGVEATEQPRRLAFGRGPLPADSELELRSGPIADELASLASEGVQTLLLEGGPTLAAGFLREELIDKLLVFVAPKLVGGDDAPSLFAGPGAPAMADVIELRDLDVEPIGDDILVTAYLTA